MKSLVFATFVLLCISFSVFAQDQDAMMKAWEAYATPGEAHKAMGNLVGTWNTTMKSYMPPADEKGTSTFKSVMEGRYIIEETEGSFQGKPFRGMGIFGFDNSSKKYVSTWVDNMSTGIVSGTGTSDDDGKTINWTNKGFDPMSGKEQTYRSAMHKMSDDQYHFEMHGPGPDGKEMKMMEVTYNRKK